MFKKKVLREIPKIVCDDVSLRLWVRCVTEKEQNNLAILKALLIELQREPYPHTANNPILKRMHRNGAGFDGYVATILTYGYLREICRYFINEAEKK